jgi:hypothetical protein
MNDQVRQQSTQHTADIVPLIDININLIVRKYVKPI